MECGERGLSGAVATSPAVDAGAWLQTIRAAAEKLKGAIIHTPAVEAPKLLALSGARIFLKYECMQATGSFKERGALLKLLSLDEAERKRGVIAISAGNHAQAVAYHAARLGIPATVVMPEGTPFNKIASTEGYGAKVILSGGACRRVPGLCGPAHRRAGLHPGPPFRRRHRDRGPGHRGA